MLIGTIYKIITRESNECYVGSTLGELRDRFQRHKKCYLEWVERNRPVNKKCTTSIYIFDKYGVDNCKIMLIKQYEVIDRPHLEAYEQLWINKLNSVNTQCTLYLKKLVQLKSRNKEANKKRVQKWMDNNRDHRKQYMKEYYQKTKTDLKVSKQCDCGGRFSEAYYPAHCKTKRHKNWIAEL